MFELPKLEYGYDALSKSISGELMRLHHDKHHQTYVDKLNTTISSFPELADKSIDELLVDTNSLPEDARQSIRNNGGGHYNHSLFWRCMSPTGGGEPTGEVADLINSNYSGFQSFVDDFTTKSLGVFGSGWTWLLRNGDIITTANQDTPISQGLETPILCLDVWEHAYYLDYKNKRDDYIKAWWEVVDWAGVNARLVKKSYR